MAVWDGIEVGDAGIDPSHFVDVFAQTGTQILATIGTGSALSSNDGVWGSGLFYDAINRTFMDFAYKSVINFEEEMYHNPHWAHPGNWTPFSDVGGALRISSTPIDSNNTAEVSWAVRKTYHLRADGGLSTWNDFGGNPTPEWSPRPKTGDENDDSPVLFDDYPMKYKSGMLFTRVGYGFGEYTFVVKLPYGNNGSNPDIKLNSATFPAAWLLQMIFLGLGVNGEPSSDTAMPFTNTGKLREPDVAEMFGESARAIHHTAHYRKATGLPLYPFENIDSQLQPDSPPLLPNDADSAFHEYKLQLTPGKLIFLIDGAVSFIVDTPEDYAQPLRIYETVEGKPYEVVKDSQGRGKWTGEYQKNPDGSLRYPRYRMIVNLAEGGKYPKDLARQLFLANVATPPHSTSNTMDVQSVAFRALVTDNPDQYGLEVGATTEVDTVAETTFEDTFKFRVSYMTDQYVNAPINVSAEVIANPEQYPYKFEISVDQSLIPAGATVTIEQGGANNASIYSDTAIDIDNAIIVKATQDGEVVT